MHCFGAQLTLSADERICLVIMLVLLGNWHAVGGEMRQM